ncbi:MAG: hypothetical protein H6737_28375 [Alphaproteobacteria bacterium]|nr:hypothetical protein [Alphaproteobacteria bacterium]
MRSWLVVFALLAGCIGRPDTTDLCYANRERVWDACELDPSDEERDLALHACERDAGFAVASGCAGLQKRFYDCVLEAGETLDCQDLAFVVNDSCSFEQGLLDGCLSR